MKSSLLIAALAAVSNALIPIEIKGNRFIKPATDSKDSGSEFTVVGIDYQPGGEGGYDESEGKDVLTDEQACLRDAYALQQLGVNTIRVYTVNPWVNHDKCMSIFNSAGIYVILDVNSPFSALSRSDPKETYNKGYLNRVFGVIDAFKGYPNLLGFFSGNEVVNDEKSAKVVPKYIRAVQRDMKQYIKKHADREIPVGYSAADDNTLREAMWMYLECGDEESRSDFYGLNSYDWCSGRDNWQTSGYGNLESTFNSSTIPLILSEYGCNVNSPRTFDEVNKGLYAKLNTVFSGGLVYEYSQEDSDYGLVDIKKDGSLKLRDDYGNLQKAYNDIKLEKTSETKLKKMNAQKCDTSKIKDVDSSFQTDMKLPKSPGEDLIKKGGGNNNVGKIVKISDLQSKYKVYNTEGKQLSDTKIEVDKDNEINEPKGNDISTKSATGSMTSEKDKATKTSSSSHSKDGAVDLVPNGFIGTVFAVIAMLI